MEEITTLFNDVKDYFELDQEIKIKIDELNCLKNEIQEIEQKILFYEDSKEELKRLKENLVEIENSIKSEELITKKPSKVSDFNEEMMALSDVLLENKASEFVDELIYNWGDDNTFSVYISKDTVQFFKIMKGREFYSTLKKKFYNRLQKLLEETTFGEFLFEESNDEIILHIGENKSSEKDSIEVFYKSYKEICNFVFQIFKNNLRNKVIKMIKKKDENFKNTYISINSMIENTRFYAKNTIQELDNMQMDVFYEIAERERKNIKISSSEKPLTKDMSIVSFIVKNLNTIDADKIRKCLIMFFDLSKVDQTLFNLFSIFSEITYIQKHIKIDMNVLSKLKGDIFCKIIQTSDARSLNLDLNDNLDDVKDIISEAILGFNEIVNFFIEGSMKVIFLGSFIDELCKNYIFQLFRMKQLTYKNRMWLYEIGNFILNQCDEKIDISSGCKLRCICFVLSSNINDILTSAKNSEICLTNQELKDLLILRNESIDIINIF
ncbi:hypothetical protein EDEG_00668 [Edhazardia aedis USNM 41457]|uniref:Exocyst complex component Sec10 n=1 Tax=Edhazardia aedis (strain USNM 41457) TaxID=1003232 RepID=J9DVE3_EDHAE|nr:hypothetical protein EDEG_00668 [Edhazardia aedis USNM 41457]|eukprot:EJW05257.1 hypothetical protein EDEG_00668 [Edhazardia aedis USNM 41457]